MQADTTPTLIVITGPTGSGKTALAITLARRLGCDVISADSRQMFKGIPITTAAPTADELATARHHFVGTLELDAYYSAAQYEEDCLRLLGELFSRGRYAVMCGGSMMYVDAVVRGIDELPTISPDVRADVLAMLEREGLEDLMERLRQLDTTYAAEVDPMNTRRVVHALEICIEAGVPYSTLRTGRVKDRPFRVVKAAIDMPREELFARINTRVNRMAAEGMPQEARRVYPLRHLNSLNTVGFKEMFAWIEGRWDFDTALARMAKNTRVYAKKQLTWLRRDPSVIWLDPHSDTPMADQVLSQAGIEP